MGRKPATLSEKHGVTLVRNKGQMIVTRLLKAADDYWKQGYQPQKLLKTKAEINAMRSAVEIYNTLLPFCLPKLQSVEFNSDLNVNLTAEQIRAMDTAFKDARKEFDAASSAIELPAPPEQVLNRLGLKAPSSAPIPVEPVPDDIMSTNFENQS